MSYTNYYKILAFLFFFKLNHKVVTQIHAKMEIVLQMDRDLDAYVNKRSQVTIKLINQR